MTDGVKIQRYSWDGSPQSITLTAAYTEENTTENRDMLTNVTAAYTV